MGGDGGGSGSGGGALHDDDNDHADVTPDMTSSRSA